MTIKILTKWHNECIWRLLGTLSLHFWWTSTAFQVLVQLHPLGTCSGLSLHCQNPSTWVFSDYMLLSIHNSQSSEDKYFHLIIFVSPLPSTALGPTKTKRRTFLQLLYQSPPHCFKAVIWVGSLLSWLTFLLGWSQQKLHYWTSYTQWSNDNSITPCLQISVSVFVVFIIGHAVLLTLFFCLDGFFLETFQGTAMNEQILNHLKAWKHLWSDVQNSWVILQDYALGFWKYFS